MRVREAISRKKQLIYSFEMVSREGDRTLDHMIKSDI
jgi:hypothetical protein